jgi:hypothetical protein
LEGIGLAHHLQRSGLIRRSSASGKVPSGSLAVRADVPHLTQPEKTGNLILRPTAHGTVKLRPFTLPETKEAYAVLEKVVGYLDSAALNMRLRTNR